MQKVMEFKIEGVAPLLMHNGLLADPLNPLVKEMKKVSSKRTKTDEDHEEMARIDWLAGLYQNGGKIIMPASNISKAVIEAARKSKKGKDVQCAVTITDDAELEFPDKGKSPEALYAMGTYTDRRMVCVQRARIARTRPRFDTWSLTFTALFDNSIVPESDLRDMVALGGQIIGLGDYRPQFGRFKIA